ncbi:MAG: hypothetical protein QGI93_09940 [Planctomycetota bacterium]|jgi:hypothetical protein|nr:hypothetical protein [Planctomycetota bacterium]
MCSSCALGAPGLILVVALQASCASSSPQASASSAQAPQQTDSAPSPVETDGPVARLIAQGDTVTLPMHVTNGYVFLDGRVGDRAGAFMFDTGSPFSFFLNNNYLALELTNRIGSGAAASGQQLTVYQHDNVGQITVGGVALHNVEGARSANFGFIEHGIRPDFLGFTGFELIRDYEFVIDYERQAIELYRTGENGDPVVRHVNPDEVVVTLTFRTETEQVPLVTFAVDGAQIEASFDCGSPGGLSLMTETRRALETSGRLQSTEGAHTLSGLTYDGISLSVGFPRVTEGTTNTMSLGYSFLREYRSVWNYRNHTITLLRR